MARRARSDRALATIVAIEAIAIGFALAVCIGQVSAHPIVHPVQDAGPVAGAADHQHVLVSTRPTRDDRDLDGVGHAAYLIVVAVPAATEEAPPFVCEIMDMDVGATDGTPAADRTSSLLATALGLGGRGLGSLGGERIQAFERAQAIDPGRQRRVRREKPDAPVAARLTGLRNHRCWVPRLAASSGSASAARRRARVRVPRGLRVNSTDVASARNSRSRLVDAWTNARTAARRPEHRRDDEQEDPDQEPHRERCEGTVVVAAPDERAVLPAFHHELQEAVGDQRHEPDQDGDVQGVARVEVADVPELVPDDALELLAVHRWSRRPVSPPRRRAADRDRSRRRSGCGPR